MNADDFGMTRGVNRAIVEASGQGIITSTTLMTTPSLKQDSLGHASASVAMSSCSTELPHSLRPWFLRFSIRTRRLVLPSFA